MANPNHAPHTPRVEQHLPPTGREHEVLDTERILHTPTPVDRFVGLDYPDRPHTLYDIQVRNAIDGEIRTLNPDQTVTTEHIDTTALKDVYQKFYEEVSCAQGTSTDPQKGVFQEKSRPDGSCASRLVVNTPHPESFLVGMQERFAAKYPDASPEEYEAFAASLANLTKTLYGSRYTEYEEQRRDLDVLPADATQEQIDAKNKTYDANILKGSDNFKLWIDEIARRPINTRAVWGAGIRNAIASPRMHIRQKRLESAEKKLARKQNKVDAANQRLDRNNLLSEDIKQTIRSRRDGKLQKYRDRVSDRTQRRDEHRQTMLDRTAEAHNTVEVNAAEHRDKIQHYRTLRQTALANKAMRKELKRSGVKRSEREEILTQIPHEQKQRIGRVITLETMARRDLLGLSHSHRETTHKIEGIESSLLEKKQDIASCRVRIERLEKRTTRFEGAVGRARDDLAKVREAVSALEQDGDTNSANYEQALIDEDRCVKRVKKLEHIQKQAEQSLADLRSRRDKLQQEHNSLEANLHTNREKAVNTKRRLDASRTHHSQQQSLRARTMSSASPGNR